MKYKVVYQKPKKKGYSKQEAVFLDLESAFFWEKLIKTQGATEIEIMVS